MPDSRWQPLLSGDDAAQAWEVIRGIADLTSDPAYVLRGTAVTAESEPCVSASLAAGCVGTGLLHAYLYYATAEDRYVDAAMAHVDAGSSLIRNHEANSSLYYGFAGVAWVLHHLSGRLIPHRESWTSAIDQQVLKLVRRGDAQSRFDLTTGYVGFGVMGLEGQSWPVGREIVGEVVTRLIGIADRCERGVFWLTQPDHLPPSRRVEAPSGMVNLGLAHGQPGVVSFLASALSSRPHVRPVLLDSIAWLLSQRLTNPSSSLFPPEVIAGREPVPSRLAWCYGDLCVSTALARAARALDDPRLEEEAALIGKHASTRDWTNALIADPGICHGSVGAALLFARLWNQTSSTDFATAARYWAMRTLAFCDYSQDDYGLRYNELLPQSGAVASLASPGLLNGAAGTALALLALVSDVEPEWDRALLLS